MMFSKKEYPILEYDDNPEAVILPSKRLKQIANVPEVCVLCFFSEAIEKALNDYPYEIVTYLKSEGINCPVYKLDYKGTKIGLIQAYVGAPMAAGHIEELTAIGFKKYLVCGVCGVLQPEIAVGRLIIPTSAVRDEGTSYHYIEPSREIGADEKVVRIIEQELLEKKIPFIKGKTWTTDAFYRETPEKLKLRKEEGCITVEMEASAFMAVSKYKNVAFGQILYSGDSLAGKEWEHRDYATREDIREFVLRTTLDIATKM
jgi:uridine phosphorylase